MNKQDRPISIKIACIDLAITALFGVLFLWMIIDALNKHFNLLEERENDISFMNFVIHMWGIGIVQLLIILGMCVVIQGLWKGERWAWFHGLTINDALLGALFSFTIQLDPLIDINHMLLKFSFGFIFTKYFISFS